MSNKLTKFCKKCNKDIIHRYVKIDDYYACSGCTSKNSKNYRKKYPLRYLAQKANARKKPGSEKITEEMLLEIYKNQDGRCALTGIKFDSNTRWWKASLDRTDCKKGYTKKNIKLIAWIVNHSKLDLTDFEFIDMCNKVATNYLKIPFSNHSFIYED